MRLVLAPRTEHLTPDTTPRSCLGALHSKLVSVPASADRRRRDSSSSSVFFRTACLTPDPLPIILFPVMSKAVSFNVRQSSLWTAKLVHEVAPGLEMVSAPLLQ